MIVIGVVDLGFGDAGKGLVVDALTRRLGATTVARVNGGAQAGHNVVTPDGRHHCFSQVGAGSFTPGVRTVHGPEVVLHLGALAVEAAALARVGVSRHPRPHRCQRTLPRGDAVGPGVRSAPRAGPRRRPARLVRHRRRRGRAGIDRGTHHGGAPRRPPLAVPRSRCGRPGAEQGEGIRRRPRSRPRTGRHRRGSGARRRRHRRPVALPGPVGGRGSRGRRRSTCSPARLLACSPARLLGAGPVVVEGAQGVLLDQDHGFHPFTTWSSCTFSPVDDLVDQFLPGAHATHLGVVRTLPVRHGPGPFPTHEPALDGAIAEAHNCSGPWQGAVRHGWPDQVMARYAADVAGRIDGVVVTHVDTWRSLTGGWLATTYEGLDRLPRPATLPEQVALTSALLAATPRLEPWSHGGAVDDGEPWAALHRAPLAASATGPTQAALRWTDLVRTA